MRRGFANKGRCKATLGACRYEGVESDSVGETALMVHLVEKLESQLPLPSLLTSRDKAAVGDHAAFAAFEHHFLKHLHNLQRQDANVITAALSSKSEASSICQYL